MTPARKRAAAWLAFWLAIVALSAWLGFTIGDELAAGVRP